jgi:hypothetical protein
VNYNTASVAHGCVGPSLLGQTKDYEIGICCFSLSTQHQGGIAKTDWLRMGIMSEIGATCLPVNC